LFLPQKKHESNVIHLPVIDENILGSTAGIYSSTSLTDEIIRKWKL
jgi:hypothetical protein